jgi:hypothetical protein
VDSNLINDLLQAILSATNSRKAQALSMLRGESTEEKPARDTDPYVPLREIARMLSLHETTLRRWKVPSLHMGRCRRCRLPEVIAFLESDDFRLRAQNLKEERKQKRQQQSGAS